MKSTLLILEDNPSQQNEQNEPITGYSEISEQLKKIGVRFEKWQTGHVSPGAAQEEVLAAYEKEVTALNREYGFQSVDVVSLSPDFAGKEALREKFQSEHTHDDFEVRFFVDGFGLFYLHVDQKVFCIFCTDGDLISVPAGVTHWFDMGASPSFRCIRFFTIAEGWLGNFTGSEIAKSFLDCDEFMRNYVRD